MEILNFNDSPGVVESTARLLNGPLPLPRHRWPPLVGVDWVSLNNKKKSGAFRRFMLELVNEWIRCGKRLMPEKMIIQAGTAFGSEWHISLAPEPTLLSGRIGYSKTDQSDPAAHSWLWRVYWDWNHRHKPYVWFRYDGRLYLRYASPAQSAPSTPLKLPPFLDSESPYLSEWDESILWFVLFLNCGHAQLLERCTHCDRYFVRKRRPKRGVDYKREPNCGKCTGRASIQRTQATRDRRNQRRVELAAQYWPKWVQSSKRMKRSEWVAGEMNPKLPVSDDKITGRWVTQHQQEIEAEVERRNHATRKG